MIEAVYLEKRIKRYSRLTILDNFMISMRLDKYDTSLFPRGALLSV